MDFESLMLPLWITPKEAVALNLAQFVALASHSKFLRRNTSLVVPHCMRPWAITVALWVTEFFWSKEFLMISRSSKSERLLRYKNSRCKSMDDRPDKILRNCARCSLASSESMSSSAAGASAGVSAGGAAAASPPSAGAAAASGAGAGAAGSFAFSNADRKSWLQKCWFSLSTMSKATWYAMRRDGWSSFSNKSFKILATSSGLFKMK
mmetsp:Transcript_133263/g.385723  ORF Transcript_133263/g.385723 Transcript_133263/m.385723 type:complete len:208 (-) Transcript_133263:754-1377(-)